MLRVTHWRVGLGTIVVLLASALPAWAAGAPEVVVFPIVGMPHAGD
jgi:hypothetical protein